MFVSIEEMEIMYRNIAKKIFVVDKVSRFIRYIICVYFR